jgi:hypothetical protein
LRSVPEDLDATLGLIEVSASDVFGESLMSSTAVQSGQLGIAKRSLLQISTRMGDPMSGMHR